MDLLAAAEERLRLIIREEVQHALKERAPEPLWLTTKEAADLLNLPVSWLAAAARRKEIPCRRFGHHVRFLRQDIEQLCTQNSGTASPVKAGRHSRKSCEVVPVDGVSAPSVDGANAKIFTRST